MNVDNQSSFVTKKRPSWWHFSNVPKLNAGSIVEAKVIRKTPKAVYLDLNHYGTGLIWGAEYLRSIAMVEHIKEGDPVKVKILNPENEFGMIEVSLQDIVQENQYQWIKDLIDKDEIVSGKVIGANRGGLLLKVNDAQGFLPTSQMSEKHFPKVEGGDKEKILEILEQLIGKEIEVKILAFNPSDGKIIFSEKKIDEDKIKTLIDQYKIGDIVEGYLHKITTSGAIISLKDQPLIKAFLPLEEASWTPMENLEQVLKPETIYQFKIVSINKNKEIILSFKSLQEDPIIQKLKQYEINQIVKGVVYKFLPFGALIQIEPDVFGFIHSSEFGGLEEMKQKMNLKQELEFIISSINFDDKRINLQLKK